MTYTYYGVKGDSAWQLDWHNSWLLVTNTNSQHMPRLMRESDQVWCQGPRGGVKIIKDRLTYPGGMYGYITKDDKAMKEFVWVKLRARKLNQP